MNTQDNPAFVHDMYRIGGLVKPDFPTFAEGCEAQVVLRLSCHCAYSVS